MAGICSWTWGGKKGLNYTFAREPAAKHLLLITFVPFPRLLERHFNFPERKGRWWGRCALVSHSGGTEAAGRDSSSGGKCCGGDLRDEDKTLHISKGNLVLPSHSGQRAHGEKYSPKRQKSSQFLGMSQSSTPQFSRTSPTQVGLHAHVLTRTHRHTLVLTHLSEGNKWWVRSSLKPTTDTNLSLTLSLLI